jgi:hypothetical protein
VAELAVPLLQQVQEVCKVVARAQVPGQVLEQALALEQLLAAEC